MQTWKIRANGLVPRSFVAGICIVGLISMVGCSGTTSAGVEATGVVTLDGKPLPNVLVNFYPTGGGSSAFASTDSEGKFTVKTSAAETGLPAGEYLVTVTPGDDAVNEDTEKGEASNTLGIPAKYMDEKKSDLKVTVKEGEENSVTIELSSGG